MHEQTGNPTLDSLYEDIEIWTTNYHTAHPEDDREDLDIWLDETVYHPASPYWPLRDARGTLIDFNVPEEPAEA